MHVVPGSHRDGPVDWQICDRDVAVANHMTVQLPAGGALLFEGLHHGTPANRMTRRRRAVQFHYRLRTEAEGKGVSC